MKKEYVYGRYVLSFLLAFSVWGFAAPEVFNFNPILGVGLCLLVPLVIYWLLKPIYKSKIKEK